MNRRGFFSLFAAAAVAPIVVPEFVELLTPTRTIFLPPVGGWRGNPLLSVQEISRELLAIFEANLVFTGEINREYEREFLSGNQWTPAEMATINIRRPVSYAVGDRLTIAGVSAVPRGTNYRGGA